MVKIRRRNIGTASAADLNDRLGAVQDRLQDWGVQALLITNRKDIRYLTGFVGEDSWVLVVAGRSRPLVLSDFRFQEQIRQEAPRAVVRIRRATLSEELAKLARQLRVKRLGLQPDYVTLTQRKALRKKLRNVKLTAVEDGLLLQRAVKGPAEIAAIRRAVRIQQEAFRRTVAQIKPGQTEQQIAAFLEYQMRLLGADGPSFPSIVAADDHASLPHAIPGARKVRQGGTVLIDWGARWGGYCSDMTRVVALGRMPAKIRQVYEVVLEAQRAAIEAIAPGKALKEIDAVARRIITKAGYGRRFGHSLGHGIGLDIHEQPTLSQRSVGQLQPGHVVTVEPGVYLPGVGGVRIEDDVLVTERGYRVLSDLPKELDSAMI